MDSLKNFLNRTFASLAIRNYRLYFFGQSISMSGTWMQTVAQGWLVLQLTGSGTQLGIVVALQFVPMLLVGPWAGLVADRFDKRVIMYWTQILFAFSAGIIAFLVYAEQIELWMLYVFALAFGIVRAFDQPARQTFVVELVGPGHLRNAISLNATVNNLARAVGPTLAGALIAGIGIAFCFAVNALTYVLVLWMLFLMRGDELIREKPAPKLPGQILEGFRYVRSTPVIGWTLLYMALIGTFAYEFQVSLPLLAQETFHGTAASYAALLAAMGIGSVIGGLFAAGRHRIAPRELAVYALLFGVSVAATALMPTLPLALVGMVLVGYFSINVTSLGNTMLQLASAPNMRGRVMSLWSMAMLGSTPIGGPIVGAIGEYAGARWGLAIGGLAALVAGLGMLRIYAEQTSEDVPDIVADENTEAAAANVKLL